MSGPGRYRMCDTCGNPTNLGNRWCGMCRKDGVRDLQWRKAVEQAKNPPERERTR